jgi:hypothetical protein
MLEQYQSCININNTNVLVFYLRQGEQLVWKKEFSKGFWHRTVVKTWAITNQRILIWNNAVGFIAEKLPLESLSDVQIINQSHVSNSSFNMMST